MLGKDTISKALKEGRVRAARSERGRVVRLLLRSVPGMEPELARFPDEEAFEAVLDMGTIYQFNAAMQLRARTEEEKPRGRG